MDLQCKRQDGNAKHMEESAPNMDELGVTETTRRYEEPDAETRLVEVEIHHDVISDVWQQTLS